MSLYKIVHNIRKKVMTPGTVVVALKSSKGFKKGDHLIVEEKTLYSDMLVYFHDLNGKPVFGGYLPQLFRVVRKN